MKIILDTSAILSLASGDILETVIESIDCIVPTRVEEELRGISQNNTSLGSIAKSVLEFVGRDILVLKPSSLSFEGEIECAYLAKEQKNVLFVITDDTKAIKKIQNISKKEVRFSTLLLFALIQKRKINREQAFTILEKMRVQRDWKNNIIYEQAKILLESVSI